MYETATLCHRTPATEPTQATAQHRQKQIAQNSEDSPSTSEVVPDVPQDWGCGFGRLFVYLGLYWSVFIPLATFALGILSVAFLRLAISVVLTAPGNVLKERLWICMWVCLPAAAALVSFGTQWHGVPFSDLGILTLLMWSDVFGALIIGGRLRTLISTKWEAPAPLSLPLASFAFTSFSIVLTFLYLAHGDLNLSSCDLPPYPFFSQCSSLQWLGGYLTIAILLFVVACGAVLPPDSNLVVAYRRLGSFIRSSRARFRAKRQERLETAKLETSISEEVKRSYPVPALYTPAVTDVMRLKLKRSQRSSMFGKMIFILDARMELTQEELDLVRNTAWGAT